MITIMADNKQITVKWLEFSDGALTCKVCPSIGEVKDYISVNVCPTTPVKQVKEELSLIDSSLSELFVWEKGGLKTRLHLPYLPYGRADRVFEAGNPNPLEIFQLDLQTSWYDEVIVYDPHNPDALWQDVINYTIIPQLQCFQQSVVTHNFNPKKTKHWDYVIAPDKGAKLKAKSIAEWLGVPCVEAEKKRDVSTGRIIETTLDAELPVGSRVIIVDDIGDYCGTHIALAKILRDMGCIVDLYVTHLIAPKGLKALEGIIDKVYAYHTVGGYINQTDILGFNRGNYGRNLETS